LKENYDSITLDLRFAWMNYLYSRLEIDLFKLLLAGWVVLGIKLGGRQFEIGGQEEERSSEIIQVTIAFL
jgi:hypothetical protein